MGTKRHSEASDPATGAPALVLLASGSHRHAGERFRLQGFAEVLFKPIVHPEGLVQALVRAACGSAFGNDAVFRINSGLT